MTDNAPKKKVLQPTQEELDAEKDDESRYEEEQEAKEEEKFQCAEKEASHD